MDERITDARAPYEPPTVEDVPLRPDEMVVAGCKTSSGAAPGVSGLPFCGFCMNTGNS